MTRQWRFVLPNGARFVNGPNGDCIIQFPEGWEESIAQSIVNQLTYFREQSRRGALAHPTLGHTVQTLPNVEPLPAPAPAAPAPAAPMNAPPFPPGMIPPPSGGARAPAPFEMLKPPPAPIAVEVAPAPIVAAPVSEPARIVAPAPVGRAFNPTMKGAIPLRPKPAQVAPPPISVQAPPALVTAVPNIGDPNVQVVAISPVNNNEITVDPNNPRKGKLKGPVVIMPQPPILKPPPIPGT